MGEFDEALGAGIKAHDDAVAARKLIYARFDAFGASISRWSGEKLRVVRDVGTRESGNPLLDSGLYVRQMLVGPETYNYLGVSLDGKNSIVLCEYSLDPNGFPVKITFGGTSDVCYDQLSLDAKLADVLRHPSTGGKLKKLLAEAATQQALPTPKG